MIDYRIVAIVTSVIVASGVWGQSRVDEYIDSLKRTHRIEYLGEGESASPAREREMIDMFYYDQFMHSQDPRVPYFMFMSRDADFAMGLGGVVRMRGWADWAGAMHNNGFIPYDIAIPKDYSRRKWLGGTPAGTALYYRIIGRNASLGNYQLYIEANFNGYEARDFHLKKAYATVNDWTVGYTNSTFSDPATESMLVDGQGPNAYVSTTTLLVRWMHTIKAHWVVAASVEMPDAQIGADGVLTENVPEWAPDVAAFGQYQWGSGQHVRLSGVMRVLPYRDLVALKNRNVIGLGVQLSSVMRPTRQLTLYATANYGKGIGSMTGDLIMGNYDLVAVPEKSGTLYAPKSFGWFGAVQYHFMHNLYASATFGELRYLPEHPVYPTEYKYGLYSAYNVFWNITPRIQVAGELNLGKRQNMNGEHRWARRISLMTQFSF